VYEDIIGPDENILSMRRMLPADSLTLLEWRNHESVRNFARNRVPILLKDHELWVTEMLNDSGSKSIINFFLEGEQPVGMSHLDWVDEETSELSILVNPSLWGRGYGSSILELTIRQSKTLLNIVRLFATIHKDNLGSIRLFTKFGFSQVGEGTIFHEFILAN